ETVGVLGAAEVLVGQTVFLQELERGDLPARLISRADPAFPGGSGEHRDRLRRVCGDLACGRPLRVAGAALPIDPDVHLLGLRLTAAIDVFQPDALTRLE